MLKGLSGNALKVIYHIDRLLFVFFRQIICQIQ